MKTKQMTIILISLLISILTTGNKGSLDLEMTSERLARIRKILENNLAAMLKG
jgi:hypothetical protein